MKKIGLLLTVLYGAIALFSRGEITSTKGIEYEVFETSFTVMKNGRLVYKERIEPVSYIAPVPTVDEIIVW